MNVDPYAPASERDYRNQSVSGTGETKREKAFWQVYCAMISNSTPTRLTFEDQAQEVMRIVDAGFAELNKEPEE